MAKKHAFKKGRGRHQYRHSVFKRDVQSLRDELEKQQIGEETPIQKSCCGCNIEIAHLRKNVQSTR